MARDGAPRSRMRHLRQGIGCMHSMIVGARALVLAGWLATGLAGTAFAQAPAVTADDYARAEKFLPHNTAPLVDHVPAQVAWIDDGQFVYRDHDADGDRFLRVDAATGGVVPAFDHVKLARALGRAAGKPVEETRLPLKRWSIEDDGRIALAAFGKDFTCDLSDGGACAEKTGEPGVRSPDGRREAFVRDWNLWLRALGSGEGTQLTTDGSTDHGYATDNGGWQHTDKAIVVWSPDSTRIATFRQDQRRTSEMVLVHTNVGAPEVERWKYPFVGDEHVDRKSVVEGTGVGVGGARGLSATCAVRPGC